MSETTDIIYSIHLKGGCCPGPFKQLLRPRERRATVKFRPGAEANEVSTQFILVKFGLDLTIIEECEDRSDHFYLQWTRRSLFAPIITTPLGIYPSDKVEIAFNDNYYLERNTIRELGRLSSEFGRVMRALFSRISATGKKLLLPEHPNLDLRKVQREETPLPDRNKPGSDTGRPETPQSAMALGETRQVGELDDQRRLHPNCLPIVHSSLETHPGHHDQVSKESNTTQTAGLELIHTGQAHSNRDRPGMLIATSEYGNVGVGADEVDEYWEWDAKEGKFRHWDESAQEWVYCPDSFD